jgi:membrane protein DedA with SNARE-associated domain
MFEMLLRAHGLFAYLIIFAVLVASAFGYPFPEDLSLVAAGILVHVGQANPWIMGLVCYLGIMVGDLVIYRIGWISGVALFRKRVFRRFFTARRLKKMRSNLDQRTFLTILLARHLFYLRTATFLMCGAVRVSPTRFIVADALAALITTPLMVGLGYLGAQHHETLLTGLERFKLVLLILGALVASILLARLLMKHRKRGQTQSVQGASSDVPSQRSPH